MLGIIVAGTKKERWKNFVSGHLQVLDTVCSFGVIPNKRKLNGK